MSNQQSLTYHDNDNLNQDDDDFNHENDSLSYDGNDFNHDNYGDSCILW